MNQKLTVEFDVEGGHFNLDGDTYRGAKHLSASHVWEELQKWMAERIAWRNERRLFLSTIPAGLRGSIENICKLVSKMEVGNDLDGQDLVQLFQEASKLKVEANL